MGDQEKSPKGCDGGSPEAQNSLEHLDSPSDAAPESVEHPQSCADAEPSAKAGETPEMPETPEIRLEQRLTAIESGVSAFHDRAQRYEEGPDLCQRRSHSRSSAGRDALSNPLRDCFNRR